MCIQSYEASAEICIYPSSTIVRAGSGAASAFSGIFTGSRRRAAAVLQHRSATGRLRRAATAPFCARKTPHPGQRFSCSAIARPGSGRPRLFSAFSGAAGTGPEPFCNTGRLRAGCGVSRLRRFPTAKRRSRAGTFSVVQSCGPALGGLGFFRHFRGQLALGRSPFATPIAYGLRRTCRHVLLQ